MKKIFAKTVMTLTALILSTGIALAALSVDSAKQQGLVGERPDGLLGVVKDAPEVNALVAQTNTERLAKYKDIASKNGADVKQIQGVAGKKLIDAAAPGEYIMSVAGSWQKK